MRGPLQRIPGELEGTERVNAAVPARPPASVASTPVPASGGCFVECSEIVRLNDTLSLLKLQAEDLGVHLVSLAGETGEFVRQYTGLKRRGLVW